MAGPIGGHNLIVHKFISNTREQAGQTQHIVI